MATPTDYIFQNGTCAKSAIFATIITKMTTAGWTNVASLATSDFTVMKSTGVNADKNLLIQLRSTNLSAANDTATTSYSQMSYRLIDTYTPGATGVAGVFGRTALAWTDLFIAPVAAASAVVPPDTTVTYRWYADAGKFIMSIEYPSSLNLAPILMYIGQPDTVKVSEALSAGMIVGTTSNATTAASVLVDNTPVGIGAVAAPYALSTTALLPLTNPNVAGVYFLSDIYYQSATEGIRGKLDGLKTMFNNKCLTGDTVTDTDGKVYYVLVCQVQGSTSFPSVVLLIRTA